MGQNSSIEWCQHTFNPWVGCSKVSPGCKHCYAEADMDKRRGFAEWGDHGTRVVTSDANWRKPLAWDRKAREAGERHRVFCASLADVFESWDGPVVSSRGNPFWWCHGSLSNSPLPSTGLPDGCRMATLDDIRERLFDLISDTPNLDWLLLTKRPENLEAMLPWTSAHAGEYRERFWPHVWLGTSVEDRKHGLPRVDMLRGVPAAVRFLSVEPLLEDLGAIDLTGVGWLIVGGESGRDARPLHPDWARHLLGLPTDLPSAELDAIVPPVDCRRTRARLG